MLKRILVLALALSFFMVLTPNTQATYSIDFTGALAFQADPWMDETFQGYVIIGLRNESQGALDITLTASGEIAPWFSWTDSDSFVLYPDQVIFVHYDIDFPASAPGKYTGLITASGIPSSSTQTSCRLGALDILYETKVPSTIIPLFPIILSLHSFVKVLYSSILFMRLPETI